MKKHLFLTTSILFLAAACNKQPVSPSASRGGPAAVQPAQNQLAQPLAQQQAKPADETANWKTYSNTYYGFEIRYPGNYSVKTFPNKFSIKYPGDNNLEYDITFGSHKAQVAAYVKALFASGYDNYGKDVDQKPISMNGASGIDISTPADADIYLQTQKGFVVRINYFVGPSEDQNYVTVGNHIVSTFKFTK